MFPERAGRFDISLADYRANGGRAPELRKVFVRCRRRDAPLGWIPPSRLLKRWALPVGAVTL